MNRQRLERITLESGKCGGRPCIRGYRIRVSDILSLLGAGASHAEILEDYPFLEDEDILAALDYAAIQTAQPCRNSGEVWGSAGGGVTYASGGLTTGMPAQLAGGTLR